MREETQFFLAIAALVAAAGLVGILLVAQAYGALRRDLRALRSGARDEPRHPVLIRAVQAYEEALLRRQEAVNVGALVDRLLGELRPWIPLGRVVAWVRFVRSAISICVVVGLLGTFFGLALALTSLTGSLAVSAAQTGTAADMIGLLGQLRGLLSGMSTAFYASLFGVGGSLVLTLVSTFAGTFTIGDQVVTDIEHYLSNEYVPEAAVDDDSLQAAFIGRLDAIAETLVGSLSSGLSGAAQAFGASAQSMGEILHQVGPILGGLSSSGDSLMALGEGMRAITEEMRQVIAALKTTQESVPQRLEALQRVEQELMLALDQVKGALAGAEARESRLVESAELFHSSARQLEGTLQEFRKEWPVIIQGLASQAGQAVEQHSAAVAEAVQSLREVLEHGQNHTLEQMESLVVTQAATAQAIAAHLLNGQGRT